MKSRGREFLLFLAAAWLVAATAGLLLLADYDSRPGLPARAPQQWPSGISFARDSTKPTLLMFLHPRCPCSRASLFELARLAQSERGRFNLHVVFAQPSEVTADWSQSELWEEAVANPELQVVIDQGGSLAQQFGVKTSGQVLVYDGAGVLQFEGGITSGRGHPGDSFGRSIVQAIAGGQALEKPVNCATFGCCLSANPRSDD